MTKMVIVKVFVVAYKNDDLLLACLQSLLNRGEEQYEIFVMNNYAPIEADRLKLPDGVKLISNQARPPFSSGHLARSWNECIMHGMIDMINPQCDILVLAQADTIFAPGAITEIKKLVSDFDYITFGVGDQIQVMTPESIRKIGLYDERFCNIGYQEADYFRRAVLMNGKTSSINDPAHYRGHNLIPDDKVIIHTPWGCKRRDPETLRSMVHHEVSMNFFRHKWGDEKCTDVMNWYGKAPKQYMLYPYFERDLPDLAEKYYCF
jgi:hypothetical protein